MNSNDGIHTYPERSPLRTNIILINRGSIIGGYADSITDDTLLRRLMQVKAPSVFERIAGLETGEQALVRWMAEENQYYNDFMLEQVQSGIGVREARIRYESRIRDRFINTFLESYMSLIPANTGSRVVDTVVSFLTHPWNPILESLEVD